MLIAVKINIILVKNTTIINPKRAQIFRIW